MGLFRNLFSTSNRRAAAVAEPSSEALDAIGRVLLLEGQWTPGQKAEYAALGAGATEAQVAFHDGELARAHALLESLLVRSRAPRWLLRDVGRARYAVGDLAGAETALRRFLDLVGDELTGDARLESAIDLVRVFEERGDVPSAIEELSKVVESSDGTSARPYLVLGQYLRQHGMLDEAEEVLAVALPIEACCGGGCGKRKDVEQELALVQELKRRREGSVRVAPR